eukprot:COSAG01_NODE_8065_length_2933_cov_26.610092_6_plen_72_part_00
MMSVRSTASIGWRKQLSTAAQVDVVKQAEAMLAVKAAGLAKHIGVSEFSPRCECDQRHTNKQGIGRRVGRV